jgi:hypothetical protein
MKSLLVKIKNNIKVEETIMVVGILILMTIRLVIAFTD